ncbi:MAG: fibronectin type III-like domain-contianing protein, partial [Dyella sp.]|nr:fibronectin type III-like domain-contianing protein [Dyella sp.]
SWVRDASQLPRGEIPGAMGGTPPESVDYNIEGADVGYRWLQARGIKPLFPFGYGLSYTTFEHGPLKVASREGQLHASLIVRNTGTRAGADVAQVYVQVPGAKAKRLAGYSKVSLKPGEQRELDIPLEKRLLADFDPAKHAWVIRGGDYSVVEGRSSEELGSPVTVQLPAGNP